MNKVSLILFLVIATISNALFSQISSDKWNYLLVREDVVMPSKAEEYEQHLEKLTKLLKANDVKHINYLSHLQDNFHYTHLTVLNKFDDAAIGLDEVISKLKEHTEIQLVWNALKKTLLLHKEYIIHYDKNLSHIPDEQFWLEKAVYRNWTYHYFIPGSENEVESLLGAWKSLYEKKGIKTGYRLFRGVLGIDRPAIIFTTWAQTPLDHESNMEKISDSLGEEGSVLWLELLNLTHTIETHEGWYLPQYSYHP